MRQPPKPTPIPAAPVGRLLRRAEVESIVGLSRSSLYAFMKRGEFPRPVRIGRGAVRWPASVVAAWVTSRRNADGMTAQDLVAEVGRGGGRL